MLRAALVVALVWGAAGVVHAIPSDVCECPGRTTLPAIGTFGVAQNVRTWHIEGFSLTSTEHGLLAANTEYTLDGTKFTTGPFVDTQAPDAPAQVHASIELEGRAIERVAVEGRIDNETAIVEITIIDGDRETKLYTVPQRMMLCHPGGTLSRDLVEVRVRALDLAGNASAAASQFVYAADRVPDSGTTCGEHHHPFRAHNGELGLVLAVGGGAILFLLVLFCARIYRTHAVEHARPVSVSRLVAEALVRLLTRRYAVATALGIAGAFTARAVDHDVVSVVIALLAAWSFITLVRLRLARARLEYEHALVERRASWLVITTVSARSQVYASDRSFAAAQRHALPTSTLTR